MSRRAILWGIPLATVLMSGVFLSWALRTPRLERTWRIHMELRAGQRTMLTPDDRQLLQGVLDDYPAVAVDMTEEQYAGIISKHYRGRVRSQHVYLIRTSPAQSKLRIRYAYPKQTATVQVQGQGRSKAFEGTVTAERWVEWDLGDGGALPELLELNVVERTKKGNARTPSVQIDWVEAKAP